MASRVTHATSIDAVDHATAAELRDELERILTRLDQLRLHLPGAHLAQSIYSLEEAVGLDHREMLPEPI